MKEHPILFNTPMVNAILDGRKTQTRRVIKPQPGGRLVSFDSIDGRWYSRGNGVKIDWCCACLYGVPGDRLWVKEGWSAPVMFDDLKPGKMSPYMDVLVNYAADGKRSSGRYRSSRFMPRWASRITLEVTDVRAERVQEISAVRGYTWESNPWVWVVDFEVIT